MSFGFGRFRHSASYLPTDREGALFSSASAVAALSTISRVTAEFSMLAFP
jgi:hypothetical protein